MAVPKYNEFFPAFIDCLGDGKIHSFQEIREYCIKKHNLTDEDLQQRLKSGQFITSDRIGWARTYLKKAGLIDSPERAMYLLTAEGKKAYVLGAEKVTLEYLQQYKSFQEFTHAGRKSTEQAAESNPTPAEGKSPQELIEQAIEQLNSSLGDTLMAEIMKMNPFSFEELVVKLLHAMRYGSDDISMNRVTKKSGDEGIDGIVTADRLGFETIYFQAKRWKNDAVIGRPEIQKFLGALAGQGATKGIFITTAKFSNEAKSFVEKPLRTQIKLIDGADLVKLMIDYDLGVSVVKPYKVKRVDYDFFQED